MQPAGQCAGIDAPPGRPRQSAPASTLGARRGQRFWAAIVHQWCKLCRAVIRFGTMFRMAAIELQTLFDLLHQAFAQSDLPLPGRQAGKVRDSYPLPGGRRLVVTTDRLSAFDRILGRVPYKGQVLNQLSEWWFEKTAQIIPNHVVETPDPNALVALDARPFAVEVVVRGYITGVTSTAL